MKRPVKVMVPLVDGMVEPQRALHAEAHGHAYGLTSRAGGAVGRLGVWHDAPGHSGSAGRHTDIRGLGPHVGKTQEGAPDLADEATEGALVELTETVRRRHAYLTFDRLPRLPNTTKGLTKQPAMANVSAGGDRFAQARTDQGSETRSTL
jgi:hypothetical protein